MKLREMCRLAAQAKCKWLFRGGVTMQPPGPAPAGETSLVVSGGITVFIDEPAGIIDSGFFHLRGWMAAKRNIPEISALVNGKTSHLYRYPRPDVQEHHPAHYTTGFSAFVRLGEIAGSEEIRIELISNGHKLCERTERVTPGAVAAAQRDEEARREKRAWILPRISCLRCGGNVNDAAECRVCGTVYERGGMVDCIPPEVRGLSDVEFNGAICSHGYDGDVESVIARAEASGGKVLDCGAGLRASIRRSVVTTEIFPYPTTDVLTVNQRLPFKDDVFDAVLSLHVLEHVPDPFRCARELYRVLKPGGTLFAVTPMVVPEHGYPHHFFNPTREGLVRLFDRTDDTAHVFVPAMGHAINGVWSVLALYRDSLPEPQREKFLSLSVRDILSRPIEDWITQDIASALSEEGRRRLAANFCIKLVKQ
jgi:SAM-dependent methyltransferase